MKFRKGDLVKMANGTEGKVAMVDSSRKRVAVEITSGTPSMPEGTTQSFFEAEVQKK